MSFSTPGQQTSQKRPWLAAVLAVLYPGLGHVYLRRWGRAIIWFILIFGTTWLLVPDSARLSEFSVQAVIDSFQAIPLTVRVSLLMLQVLNIVDAYWLARRGRGDETQPTVVESETQSCPNCGKELDEDIDFCHWCTTRLDDTDDEE